MPGALTKTKLLKQMSAYFPDRWEVTRLQSHLTGNDVAGTVKIHCMEDDKVFLSDFSARIDAAGTVKDLTLDGVHVGKFVGRLHGN
jgi:hypothetical protein